MIVFRGRNKVTNEYIYGDIYQRDNGQTFIMDHEGHVKEVDRETVAISSGLQDEQGNEIFVEMYAGEDTDTTYREGELILYQNGSRFEIGRIKRIVNDGAFVYYHSGDTAAKTPFDCMRKLTNAHTIVQTTLGGGEACSAEFVCPVCGKDVHDLYRSVKYHCLMCGSCAASAEWGEETWKNITAK